jgi:pentatricopeptide repeat protein
MGSGCLKFVNQLQMVASHYENAKQWSDARRLYLRGLEADNLAESFYQGLIRCHMQLGQRAEALSAYRRMRETLSRTLGLLPSTTSAKLYTDLFTEEEKSPR